MKISMSKIGRAERCPASTFLPQVKESRESADKGTAIHAYLAAVHSQGVMAILSVPEKFRAECDAIELSELPHVQGDAWAIEVGLAWDWENDIGRELFRGESARDYSSVGATELPGTADVLGCTESSVVVLDLKTGWARLGPPADSPQLLSYAVAASRAYAKDKATVGWIRLIDGEPRFEVAHLDQLQLDMAADRLRRIIDGAIGAEHLHRSDPELTVPVIGQHCRYCPCWRNCPGHVGLMRELATIEPGVGNLPVLNSETAPRVWERLEAAERVLKETRVALEEYARSNPFDLPDGDRVALVERRVERIDALVAKEVLPEDVWVSAVELKYELTKTSLKSALKKRLASGEKISLVEQEHLARLRNAGGTRVDTYSTVRRFRPKSSKGEGE